MSSNWNLDTPPLPAPAELADHDDAATGDKPRISVPGVFDFTKRLQALLEEARRAAEAGVGEPTDGFYGQAVRDMLDHALPVLYCAWGTVSLGSLLEFGATASTDATKYLDPEFCETNFAARTLMRAVDDPAVPMARAAVEAQVEYWLRRFPYPGACVTAPDAVAQAAATPGASESGEPTGR